MLFFILSIFMFYFWSVLQNDESMQKKQKDPWTEIFSHVLFLTACLFMIHTLYIYVVLPAQIKAFYNSGSGLVFKNSAGNVTTYDLKDERIMYYQTQTNVDYWVLSMFKDYGTIIFVLILMIFGVWYSWNKVLLERSGGLEPYDYENPMKSNLRRK